MPWFTDTSAAPKYEVSRGNASTKINMVSVDTDTLIFKRVVQVHVV